LNRQACAWWQVRGSHSGDEDWQEKDQSGVFRKQKGKAKKRDNRCKVQEASKIRALFHARFSSMRGGAGGESGLRMWWCHDVSNRKDGLSEV